MVGETPKALPANFKRTAKYRWAIVRFVARRNQFAPHNRCQLTEQVSRSLRWSLSPMKSWNVEGNIISVDFQKAPTDEQLRRQAIDIMLLACDPTMIGAEFGADAAPSEVNPDKPA